MNKIKEIKSKAFFAKEYKDGTIVLFKNIDANDLCADQIHSIVKKKNNSKLFVSDIVERLTYPDYIKDVLKDSLYICLKNGDSILAHKITEDKIDGIIKHINTPVLKIERDNKKILWSIFISGILLSIIAFVLGYRPDKKNHITENPDSLVVDTVIADSNAEDFIYVKSDTVIADSVAEYITEKESHVYNQTNIKIPEDFVLIQSGTLYKYEDSHDVYKNVSLDAFYICKHEVSQNEYKKIMGRNPSQIIGDNIPVNTVSFIDAILYCNQRSKAEGYDGFYKINGNIIYINPNSNGYRLPNKYEWAYASRKDGRTKTKYAAGDNIKDIAWYGGNSKYRLHPICNKSPNGRGIYDLNGNVNEWIWEKNFDTYNGSIGSDFMSYISFGESDIIGSIYCSEENGFRVVLVTKEQKNSNTNNLLKVRYYKKERHSSVEYKKKIDKEDAERARQWKTLKAEANKYIKIADQAYERYVKNFDEAEGEKSLIYYRKALNLANEYHLFYVSEKEKVIKSINALEIELK